MTELRCAAASEDGDEPIAGTAPTDDEWFFVEHPGPWGRKAVKESRLPAEVVAHLGGLRARVQLIRRHAGERLDRPDRRDRLEPTAGIRVVAASLAGEPRVRTALLDDVRDLPALRESDLTARDAPLWLVCTNGRRDVCCAERGRPVAAALAARWPEATWETTHLGGHRFAATLLALPSGVALGRLDAASAVAACEQLADGALPLEVTRGRSGWPDAAQVADLHLRRRHGWTRTDDVALTGVDGDEVVLATPDGPVAVTTTRRPGPARRASCVDVQDKATTLVEVTDVITRPRA